MAEPMQQLEEAPLHDPAAIERGYRHARARRNARIAHRRKSRRANVRFWLVLLGLVVLAVFLALTMWHEVQRLFGL
jgi:hypothetical protein